MRCDHKVHFFSLVAAVDEFFRRKQQPRSTIRHLYKCRDCGYWHFTSWRKPRFTTDTRHLFDFGIGYYAVVVDGKKVWQSLDQAKAERKARKLGGSIESAFQPTSR